MPLWTNKKPPHWIPTAEATEKGWSDPVTGEVYVAVGGLNDKSGATISRIMLEKSQYKLGDVIKAYVYFSEDVDVVGTPRLTLKFNNQVRTADYAAGTGTNKLEFRYTTQTGDSALITKVTATSPLVLNGGSITDKYGDSKASAVLTFTSAAYTKADEGVQTKLPGYQLNRVVVDVDKPTVEFSSITFTEGEDHPAGVLQPVTGDTIQVALHTSEIVAVTGTPQVALTIGASTVYADFAAISADKRYLYFTYVVEEDVTAALTELVIGELGLNEGTIKDTFGNPAILTFESPDTSTWQVNDVTAATVSRVAIDSDSAFDGELVTGDTISLTLTFSEPVSAFGDPTVPITINTNERSMTVSAQSSGNDLIFVYTVTAEDAATAGQVSVGAVTYAPESEDAIKDLSMVDATVTFEAPDVSTWVINEAVDPTLGVNSLVSSAHATHPVTDDILTFTVAVDEPVVVVGAPTVVLTVNGTARNLVYDAVNSTDQSLKFTYTVVAEDVATAGQLTIGAAVVLGEGITIKDHFGNDAVLDFVGPDLAAWAVN